MSAISSYPLLLLVKIDLVVGKNGYLSARIDSDYKLSEMINSLAYKTTTILPKTLFFSNLHR